MTKGEKRERLQLAAEFFWESLSKTQRNIVENFQRDGYGVATRDAARGSGELSDEYFELVELGVLNVSARQLSLSGLGRYLGQLCHDGLISGGAR